MRCFAVNGPVLRSQCGKFVANLSASLRWFAVAQLIDFAHLSKDIEDTANLSKGLFYESRPPVPIPNPPRWTTARV
jgi:hypothetical protein